MTGTIPTKRSSYKITWLKITLLELSLAATLNGFSHGHAVIRINTDTVPGWPARPGGVWINKVIVSEYRTWYIRNDSTVYGLNNNSPHPVPFRIGGRKAVTGAGGFNVFRVLDDQGYLWTSKIDYTTNCVRTDTDTTGAPFGGNIFVDAYGNSTVTIRADSSVWYMGDDSYHLFHTNGSINMLPTQLSPGGMKVKKLLLGGTKIVLLTTHGQVWEWLINGSRIPTKKKIPRPAIDIFVSHLDLAGCVVPDPTGSQTMGYPYIWGTTTSMYGGGPPFNEPTSIKSLWKMRVPIKEISASWNTIHYIDSLGRLFGIGFNSMGEVGNGQEFANKYDYPGFPGYGWDFKDYENPSGAPPAEIGKGITWKHLFSNNWYAFYKYALDANGDLYSWGRNKSIVLGNGFFNMQEQYSYDALDVLRPTMVHPLTVRLQTYTFTPPSIHAGSNQAIPNSTVLLSGSATPPLLIKSTLVAANGVDTIGYKILSYQWTKIKGAGGKITSPASASTTVTGLSPGTYVFNLKTTDSNTGTLSADVTITVNGPDHIKKK